MRLPGKHTILTGLLFLIVAAASAMAQEAGTRTQNSNDLNLNQSARYTPFSFDFPFTTNMVLQQVQNRFFDTYVDPDEYVIGPGDRFGIFFTSGQIGDLSCETNSDGTVFIKSLGSIELAHVTLRLATEKIRAAIEKIYPRSDFAVQLTGFRISRINVIGEISRPGAYYAPAVWRVSDVINLAGGLTSTALPRQIVLRGFGRDLPVDLTAFVVRGDRKSNPLVCNGDIIVVPHQAAATGYVTVSGEVNRPGTFESVAGDRLNDLLDFVGGLKGEAAKLEIVVTGNDGRERVRLDGASETVAAFQPLPGDNIRVAWKDGRRDFGAVEIMGAVERPGRYPIPNEQFTVADLFQLCGGARPDANVELMQLFRRSWKRLVSAIPAVGDTRDPLTAETGAAREAPDGESHTLVSCNPRDPWKPSGVTLIDGDSLYLPEATGMVMVTGAVAAPGLVRYQKGQRIDYYLRQAGSLGFDADRSRMVVINPVTGARIGAAGAGALFDSEILYVPRKESQAKP